MKNLYEQIKKFRVGILDSVWKECGVLQDEHLDFPVEDQTEYDKGYECALRDIESSIERLKAEC